MFRSESSYLCRIIVPSVLFALLVWLLSAPIAPDLPFQRGSESGFSNKCPRHTLILTAHPDDECMFFAPTVLSLASSGCKISALCLSTGNSSGLGPRRSKELYASYARLGIHSEAVHITNHPDLQDDITREWDSSIIADVLADSVAQLQISTILTFDTKGISGHPNHIALSKGAMEFVGRNRQHVALFNLDTVPIMEKYIGNLAPLYQQALAKLLGRAHIAASAKQFISSFGGYAIAFRAMQEHWSQLVWFRWLYILTSRYMWINEWTAVESEAAVPEP